MTDEERLAWFRQQREKALTAVRRVDEKRIQHFDLDGDEPLDVTAEWQRTMQMQADMFGRLIDDLEAKRS